MKLWLRRLDRFGKQDASKGVLYKQSMGIFGRFEASRKGSSGTLYIYIKKQRSEIQTSSDKATMKRFSAVGIAGSCTQIATGLPGVVPRWGGRGDRSVPLTGPCLGLLRMSSVAPSQIHQESSEREMVTGAGCCTGASLGKGEKWKRGDRRNPHGISAFSVFVETYIRYPLFFLLPSVS